MCSAEAGKLAWPSIHIIVFVSLRMQWRTCRRMLSKVGRPLCLQASPSQVLKPRSTPATSCSDTFVEQISWDALLSQCGSDAKHRIAQRICCVKDRHTNVCLASSCSVSLTNKHRQGPAHKVLPWSSCCSASRGSPERQHYAGRTISFARPHVLFV